MGESPKDGIGDPAPGEGGFSLANMPAKNASQIFIA